MRKLLTTVAKWRRWHARGSFAELDRQIDKLRVLRDSYQAPQQTQLYVVDDRYEG
jgi:hypothetical protein